MKRFFSTGEISPKNRKLKIKNSKKSNLGCVQSTEVRFFVFFKAKIARFIYLVLTVSAKDIGG